jgi:YggT family protein
MLLLANLLTGIAYVLSSIVWFMYFLIIAAVIMSWVSADPRNPLVQFVRNTTEPLFLKVRKYIPPLGMLDITPIVLLIGLQFISSVVVNSLIDYGNEFRKPSYSSTIVKD